jgi:hypothetical protein
MQNFLKFSDKFGLSFDNYNIQYRIHAIQRMFSRNIRENEIIHILLYGFTIEQYDNDYPFPSMLISGITENNRPLHAVDINEKRLYIITVYEPDPGKWSDDFTRRIQ